MAVFYVSGIPEKNFSVRFETYTQKKRQPTSTQSTEGAAADDGDDSDNDDDDNPNLSELQVVPFQGHPFIILHNDLTYHCKFGKDCDIQYRRKMQQLKPKVHWVPLTTSSVTTGTCLERTDFFCMNIIDCNVKKFDYNEHSVVTNSFLLLVSGSQCTSKSDYIQ